MLVLGMESSCDETSAAVVEDGRTVRSNIINSQIQIHQRYGGVVPEIASRCHVESICEVTEQALETANVSLGDIDAVAVTYGPGLVGALLTGLSYAKGLAYATKKPIIGVHHIEGHVCSNYLNDGINSPFEPPFVCLIVSGGHTHIVYVSGYGSYEVLGKTADDAAGEAYDKVARTMGLSYPGGVMIDRLAKDGNPHAIDFPRAMINSEDFNFSFSGLKSAVINYLHRMDMLKQSVNKADVAASFQQSVVDVLVKKSIAACKSVGCKTLALAGGVSANSALRREMSAACTENGIAFKAPMLEYCTDNAAMIASCGYFNYTYGGDAVSGLALNAYPSLKIGEKIGKK